MNFCMKSESNAVLSAELVLYDSDTFGFKVAVIDKLEVDSNEEVIRSFFEEFFIWGKRK